MTLLETHNELKTFALNTYEALSATIDKEIKKSIEASKKFTANCLEHEDLWTYITALAEMKKDTSTFASEIAQRVGYIGTESVYGKLFYLSCVCHFIEFGEGYEHIADGYKLSFDASKEGVHSEVEHTQDIFEYYENLSNDKEAIQNELDEIELNDKQYSSYGVMQLALYKHQLEQLSKAVAEEVHDMIAEFLEEWSEQDLTPITAQACMFFTCYE
ncbi:hypothetical protein GUM57_21400 [Vibrio parahaemolyticus]|nr:hypothetical protein [Vibrio parahaemolyticus]